MDMNDNQLTFVSSVSEEEVSGVSLKTKSQIEALISSGSNVHVVRPKQGGIRRALLILKFAQDLVRNPKPNKTIFVRYDVYTAGIIILAWVLGHRIITEINGNLEAEHRASKHFAKYLIQYLCNQLSLRCVSVCIAPSEDIAKPYRNLVKSVQIVPNAASIENYTCHEQPMEKAPNTGKVTFLYSGTLRQHHGLDRFIHALAEKEMQSSHLVIAGDGPEMDNIRKLVNDVGVADRVSFLGWCSPGELYKISHACDIGLGPLALERVGLHNGSPLKVREYLALGLPVIVSYDEDPVLLRTNYIQKVSVTSKEMAKEIHHFVSRIVLVGGPDLRREISSFAKTYASYDRWAASILHSIKPLSGVDVHAG